MASFPISSKIFIGHPTFSQSIGSHGSVNSTDTNYRLWRRAGTIGNEDVGTQTEHHIGHVGADGNVSSSRRALFGDRRRRKDDTILGISLESMKYNGGNFLAFVFSVFNTCNRCTSINGDLSILLRCFSIFIRFS